MACNWGTKNAVMIFLDCLDVLCGSTGQLALGERYVHLFHTGEPKATKFYGYTPQTYVLDFLGSF